MKLNIVTLVLAAIGTSSVLLATPSIAQNSNGPTIRISSGTGDNATLDPDRATTTADLGVVNEIFNGLVRFPPGSIDPKELEPDLAESWNTSKDGEVWTFHLRKGVQFQGNYGEMTSADVVYSLKRAADPKRSSFARNYSNIEDIKATDRYTVQITLKHPDTLFLGQLSNYHGGYILSEKAAEELGSGFGAAPIGTGPFSFKKHVTQQYLELEAHNSYFRGKPRLAGIIYRMIPSDSARELAFDTGELDLIYGKREQRWVNRARERGYNVDVFGPAEFRILHLNRDIKPLDNLKVREAIASAVNVDQIVEFVGKEVAEKGCSVVPNGYLGHDCSAGTYTYDVANAKRLLSEAGYPNGIDIKSIVSNISAQLPIMEVIQAQLAQAGIRLKMEVVDHATYQARSRKDQSAMVFYGAARFPNADAYLSEFFDSASQIGSPTAMSNFSHCSVGDTDIRAARIEPDPKKQLALWKDAQVKIHNDVCGIPLFGLKQVWAHSPKVHYGYTLEGAMNLAPPVTEKTELRDK